MRSRLFLLIVLFPACLALPLYASQKITVTSAEHLQRLFENPVESLIVYLSSGEYHLEPFTVIDSTCGNCEEPQTHVNVTAGLQISGENIWIAGPRDRSAILFTHAGYGLYIKDCSNCNLVNLSITGGERDPDGNATDAAVVVKNSTAIVQNNRIFDNIGDSTVVRNTVVGIMGICGRERSLIQIVDNEIVRNSWDGIALYRDSEALIQGNIIDGIDKARGARVGGGRGVGIGVTWNAKAAIVSNLVKRYWKGIGIFVNAHASVQWNIVEDIITWGIALWDAGKGEPIGVIEENVVYNTGACGASITRSAPIPPQSEETGCFMRNILVRTAQDTTYDDPDLYCYQCALAIHAVPDDFLIRDNVFFDNRRATEDLPDQDVSKDEFLIIAGRLHMHLVGQKALKASDYLEMFYK